METAKEAREDTSYLTEALRESYALPTPITLSLLRDGQAGNRTYLVEAAGGRSVLRVYGPSWVGREGRIQFELEFLTHLRQRGAPVSYPEPRADGKTLGSVPTPRGPRPCALFTFAEGGPLWPPGASQSYHLGAALASLHLAGNDFRADRDHAVYDMAGIVDVPVGRMMPFLGGRADRLYLERLADQIREKLGRIPSGPDEFGVIHGDIHQGNCHFTEGGQVTLFDFSLCGVGWRGFDLTGFLWPLRDGTAEDKAIKRSCEAYLDGYQSRRPLSPAEFEAIPAFVKARDLWETGDWIRLVPETEAAVFSEGITEILQRFREFPLE